MSEVKSNRDWRLECEQLRAEVDALTQSRNNAVKEAGKVILDLRAELAKLRELLRDIRVHGEEAEGVSERLDAAIAKEKS